jgi:uncharacterized protein YhfF
MRERLVAAVLRREKTATTSLLAELEANQETVPAAGERLTVVDSRERPVIVIELLVVEVVRLRDVELSLALEEGEGFESVAEWRRAHEQFWTAEVIPRLPAGFADSVTDDTEIVVARFRLVTPSRR